MVYARGIFLFSDVRYNEENERGHRMEAKESQYYVLLSALCTTYTQSIDQQIAKWINPHYLKVLEYIRKHEGVKPSELAEVFRMSKSNVTKIISYFVRNDFVEREVEQKDRRSLRLKTTPYGRRVCGEADAVIMHFAVLMAEAFEDVERESFMRRLVLAMQKINKESHVMLDDGDDFSNTDF